MPRGFGHWIDSRSLLHVDLELNTQLRYMCGGISKRGATAVVIFTGIMNATRYTNILDAALVPLSRVIILLGIGFSRIMTQNTQAGGHKITSCGRE